MKSPGTQPEFDYRVEERDWTALKLLVEELKEELAERRSHLLFRLSGWYFAIKVFKRVETEKIVVRSPVDRDVNYHRAMLAFLRGCGEMLLVEFKTQQDIDPNQIGVSFADLSAMVEELRMSERERYGDMKESRRSEILNDVFGQT